MSLWRFKASLLKGSHASPDVREKLARARAAAIESGFEFERGHDEDEIMQLADCVTSLVSKLNERESDLRALHDELEARVEAKTSSLRRANTDLESFTRSVSHDIRGPIGTMGVLLRRLISDPPEHIGPSTRRILSSLAQECDRLRGMAEAMMALARVEQQPLQRQKVAMRPMVDEAIDSLRIAAGQLVSLNVPRAVDVLTGALPEVQGDPILLRQVWDNLLSNAFKFSAKVNRPQVRIYGHETGDEITFVVEDNGAGFDSTRANALFGAFQRAHSSAEFNGTGVGLSIVKRIIHRHGGRVWCKAQIGQGAQFFFSLPKSPRDDAQVERHC